MAKKAQTIYFQPKRIKKISKDEAYFLCKNCIYNNKCKSKDDKIVECEFYLPKKIFN